MAFYYRSPERSLKNDIIFNGVSAELVAEWARVLTGRVVRGRKNPLHFSFTTRLRQIRRERDQSASALSLAAGLDRGCVAQLESGRRIPRISTVVCIAEALGVSAGWLAFGLGSECAPTGPGVLGLAKRARDAREGRGWSLAEVGRRVGSSAAAVHSIESGATPTLDTVESLSQALGVSAAWLAFGIGPVELAKATRPLSSSHP